MFVLQSLPASIVLDRAWPYRRRSARRASGLPPISIVLVKVTTAALCRPAASSAVLVTLRAGGQALDAVGQCRGWVELDDTLPPALRPTCTRRCCLQPAVGTVVQDGVVDAPRPMNSSGNQSRPGRPRWPCCRAAIVRLVRVSDTTPSNTMDVGFAGASRPVTDGDVATV